MGVEPDTRRLRSEDAAALMALRREALESEPLAFAASPEDDLLRDLHSVRALLGKDGEGQATFGRFDGAALAGMIGLIRESRVKQRHKATIVGMFVLPRARNRGYGRALLDAAIAQARGWGLDQVQLSVTDAAPAAKRLYERAGFREWGREPRALHWNGRFVDEHHLVLELRVLS
jgi:ribosomal protein S18 acetylase RimI-like enzyme